VRKKTRKEEEGKKYLLKTRHMMGSSSHHMDTKATKAR
jgi:hypothetical protein